MSYSEKAGVLTSWATGRQYRFSRTPDGSGKRNAISQLENDDREYRAAAESRAGRTLTQRELMELKHPPKPKLSTVISQPVDDGRTNHWQRALADINKMPARTPAEKAQKRRMLEALEAGSLKFQADLEAQDARDAMLSDPAVSEAIKHARDKIIRMEGMTGVTEADIADARQRLAVLEASAIDPDAHGTAAATYLDTTQRADKAILDRYKARRKEQETLLKQLNEQVKSGELELVPDNGTPAAWQPTSDIQAVQQRAADLGITE